MKGSSTEFVSLTPRELEVLRLMLDNSHKEIAHKLGISRSTVSRHQFSIRKKFGLVGEGRLRTVLTGVRLGLIDL